MRGNFWNDRCRFLVLNNTSAHVKGIFHDTSSLSLGRRGRRFSALSWPHVCCAACGPGSNPEVDAGAVYSQSAEFHTGASDDLTGICISVPQERIGHGAVGKPDHLSGNILTAGQLDTMTFHPTAAGGQEAQLTYLPIYGNRVEQEAVLTISIRSKRKSAACGEKKAVPLKLTKIWRPIRTLKAKDPEGKADLPRWYRRPNEAEVVLGEESLHLHAQKTKWERTPSALPSQMRPGAVSNEATVTIEILKPLDNTTYQDMKQTAHEFEALWMKIRKGSVHGTVARRTALGLKPSHRATSWLWS